MKTYLIGETAYNHEGNFNYLKKMTVELAELKVNAVKFHLLLKPESYIIEKHPLFAEIKKWTFSKEQWSELFDFAATSNQDVVALCDDVESLEFINQEHPGIHAVELHASGLNDFHLLMEASKFPGLIILGVGGSTLDEIQYALELLRKEGKTTILLMYGFQSYPTNYAVINLSKMLKLQQLFELPVGYADHTAYDDPNNVTISCMAAMMGIPILEKHYTPDFGVERIDYHAAVGKEQMKQIQTLMELALTVYGNGSLEMGEAEKKYGNTGPMKKAIVAAHDIHCGEILSPDNLVFKRTIAESPVKQQEFPRLCGLKANKEVKRDELVTFNDVEYSFEELNAEDFTNVKRDEK